MRRNQLGPWTQQDRSDRTESPNRSNRKISFCRATVKKKSDGIIVTPSLCEILWTIRLYAGPLQAQDLFDEIAFMIESSLN